MPTALNIGGSGPCATAYNCCDSEMGHMFYGNWGATAGNTFSTGTNAANLALFSNVRSDYYWSSTEYVSPNAKWVFNNEGGTQLGGGVGDQLYAVAVRPGDVTAVPEPQTIAMLLLGLGGVLVAARRRPN